VRDRHVTQGVRSEAGNEWNERFWTVVSTCRKQGRNLMDFLRECVSTCLYGGKPPTLIPM
ncbi:MAG: IS66-like element ISCku6 family transposase, partial [Thermoguttaceae bacterium]